MPEPVLVADRIGMRFGGFQALSDLCLSVGPNVIHSLIGPNGAGKTTLFNALTGVRRPTSGTVRFDGRDVTRAATHTRVHHGMSRSFQVTALFAESTVEENLRLAVQARHAREGWVFWRGTARRTDIHDEVRDIISDIGLAGRSRHNVEDLSHGGQRSLEIGMALAGRPKMIFLDEPLAGMGIDDVHRTKELIKSLRSKMAVLLIEHNMSVVLDISDRITVMAAGRKIAEGSPDDIRQDAVVRSAYLGSSA
jgi:branched-chain amino acid transport system ATP-binding protein